MTKVVEHNNTNEMRRKRKIFLGGQDEVETMTETSEKVSK
jgi:hypothetical protein